MLMSNQKLKELVNRLSVTFFDKPFKDHVRFNHRLRTTGGRYLPAKRLIELNPKYALEMGDAEFHGIIKHELCHYHLHIEGKGYKHGDRDFKELLKETGSPRHCNPLPSEVNSFKYKYECSYCHRLYKRKRRIDTKKYVCGKCKGKLVAI
ncbi:SprT family protein [Oceanobacillus alkalisoli]|uniref:SprT family protein n=1 Tax=Oceanobacillus alkalisoli TaxID=2925113 RepID=UPI001EF13BDE|nr:SprT family protein [Oceanobacillus alkalisoli]MCF3944660.1 SprT family protein [Oceanobacillus alkalisoli]MCG5104846.1 SprT family protein [Oceanobacillus alkalisoli]